LRELHRSEHELARRLVFPYLETNRLRPRVRVIKKTRPIAYRAKVLGQALLAARADANRFWMLLSGNAEVSFPPTNATTAVAVSLPTTTAADATGGSSAAKVATPSIGQKRKAHPQST
jgi:hypothetical protein